MHWTAAALAPCAGWSTRSPLPRSATFTNSGQREIEVELNERFRISPEIAAAMRSTPGVLDVELV